MTLQYMTSQNEMLEVGGLFLDVKKKLIFLLFLGTPGL